MKFLADMGISLKTVDFVRKKGFDIVHLRDEGLQRLDEVNRHIGHVLHESKDSLTHGAIISVGDTQYRVRILPI